MSFIPNIITNNINTIKKQIHIQELLSTRWVINNSIIGDFVITVVSNNRELIQKRTINGTGDYFASYVNNIVILEFTTPFNGVCELIEYPSNKEPNITTSKPDITLNGLQIYILLPHKTDNITINYQTTKSINETIIYKLFTSFQVLIDNQVYSIYQLQKLGLQLAQQDIIYNIYNNINNIYYNNFIILNNTLEDILKGQFLLYSVERIFVENNVFSFENNSITPFIRLK